MKVTHKLYHQEQEFVKGNWDLRWANKSGMRTDFAFTMAAESVVVKNMSKDYNTSTHPLLCSIKPTLPQWLDCSFPRGSEP